MSPRPRRVLVSVVLVAVLAAGHWIFHYSPRLRAASPSGPEALLLDAPWAEAAVWLPYPHQNLPVLEERAGLVAEAAEDVLTLSGVETPGLPAFGGMLAPPARSAVVAVGPEGEMAVAVRVYPAFAAFARLAGRLAGNPWLRGGDVVWRDRPIKVGWSGTTWLAGYPELPRLAAHASRLDEGLEPALLVATARRPSPPLPAGRYRLRLEGGDLVVRSQAAETAPAAGRSAAPVEALDGVGALLVILARGEPSPGQAGAVEDPAQALVFFSQDTAVVTELPRAAVLHRGVKRWKLPAESLLELAGRRPAAAGLPGWSLVATDAASLGGARRLAAPLETRLRADRGRRLELWLRLVPASAEMGRLRRGLEQAPFLSRRRLRRWQAADRLLAGLSRRHDTLHLDVTLDGGLVLRVLERSPAPSGAASAGPRSPGNH